MGDIIFVTIYLSMSLKRIALKLEIIFQPKNTKFHDIFAIML